MTNKFPCYPRAPSKELVALLKSREFLRPLIDLSKREVRGLRLDVHFRADDSVAVYCGLANILKVRLSPTKETIEVAADETYSQQCQALFHERPVGDPGFGEVLDAYIDVLEVDRRYIEREGRVQLNWSKEANCWSTFDREAKLSYGTRDRLMKYVNCSEVVDAREELDRTIKADDKSWKRVPDGEHRKLDLLACDREGQLVLIEVKQDFSDYYAPLQLLHYIWDWYRALQDNDDLPAELRALIERRVEVGLSASARPLTGRIRPVVAIGEQGGSKEDRRRYGKVLEVINRHLPPDVSPVETWRHRNGRPERLP